MSLDQSGGEVKVSAFQRRPKAPMSAWIIAFVILVVGLVMWGLSVLSGPASVIIVVGKMQLHPPFWCLPFSGVLVATAVWILLAAATRRIEDQGALGQRVSSAFGISAVPIALGLFASVFIDGLILTATVDVGRVALFLIFGCCTVLFGGAAAAAIRADGGLWVESHWGGLGGGLGGWRISQALALTLLALVAAGLTLWEIQAPKAPGEAAAKPPDRTAAVARQL